MAFVANRAKDQLRGNLFEDARPSGTEAALRVLDQAIAFHPQTLDAICA
jgi:hypothetical protein